VTRRDLLASIAAFTTSSEPSASRCWITLDLLHGARNIHWPSPDNPINMGSLLKPFLVLAYAATHAHFPIIHCNGTKDGCWLARGHADQDILNGLANSCNAYFLSLANALDRAALESICLSYGLSAPSRTATSRQLIGLDQGWPQNPAAVVDAFARLLQNRRVPAVEIVMAGMSRCAEKGTARAVGFPCYAKTGTGPCTHTPRAPGDGFVVALYPLIQPRMITLLEQHGTTGAETARGLLHLPRNMG
jgi:hypothetical protein